MVKPSSSSSSTTVTNKMPVATATTVSSGPYATATVMTSSDGGQRSQTSSTRTCPSPTFDARRLKNGKIDRRKSCCVLLKKKHSFYFVIHSSLLTHLFNLWSICWFYSIKTFVKNCSVSQIVCTTSTFSKNRIFRII